MKEQRYTLAENVVFLGALLLTLIVLGHVYAVREWRRKMARAGSQ